MASFAAAIIVVILIASGNAFPGSIKIEVENCPTVCMDLYDPVCGTDGQTYSNSCMMDTAACLMGTKITTAYKGVCQEPPMVSKRFISCDPIFCGSVSEPVCGSDGKVYGNRCLMNSAACLSRQKITLVSNSECESLRSPVLNKRAVLGCPSGCFGVNRPVCGSDGRTYGSKCRMDIEACLKRKTITAEFNGRCEDVAGGFMINRQ